MPKNKNLFKLLLLIECPNRNLHTYYIIRGILNAIEKGISFLAYKKVAILIILYFHIYGIYPCKKFYKKLLLKVYILSFYKKFI
jgi:hypothetical protein